MEIRLAIGRNLIVSDPLLNWTSYSENHLLRKVKILKFGLLSWKTFVLELMIRVQPFEKSVSEPCAE
jgi:hypothetical protein